MNNFLRQKVTNMKKTGSFLANLKIFKGILRWLTGLVTLTEEELKNAGIYPGNRHAR